MRGQRRAEVWSDTLKLSVSLRFQMKRQERLSRNSMREKVRCAIHLMNIWKQSNETENNPFQPVQERHKTGKAQESARGGTQ